MKEPTKSLLQILMIFACGACLSACQFQAQDVIDVNDHAVSAQKDNLDLGDELTSIASLPSGPGLSWRHPGDVAIEHDPKVVFAENFEEGGVEDLEAKWGYINNRDGKVMAFSDDAPEASFGERSLKVTATRGENAGGELYKTFDSGWDKIYLRFYTKFAEDHGEEHHFVALRGFKNPLPYPVGDAGKLADDYFGVTVEPATNERNAYPTIKHAPPGIWQFYAYWPEMRSWQTEEGVPDGRPNPYYGNTIQPEDPCKIPRGKWICVEFMVKLNSSSEAHDGELALWIDGKPVLHLAPGTPRGYWSRDQFRNDPEHPSAEIFDGFRWRTDNDVKINVLRLQHYVSGTAFGNSERYANENPGYLINTQQATVWFDHVVMATEYIGPIKEPAYPAEAHEKKGVNGEEEE